MKKHNEMPDVFVMNPDRRQSFGALRNIESFTEDIRFNACSEVNLTVANKVCDPLTGRWISNPAYDHIEKNNLLYLCDNNEYFSFPNRTIRDDYSIQQTIPNEYGRRTDRYHVEMTYENKKNTNGDGVLNGFSLAPETHLYNISIAGGYNWENLSEIDEFGFWKQKSWIQNFYKVACTNYIPIQPYDIISIRNRMYKDITGVDDKFLTYDVYFYTDADANTYVGEVHIQYNIYAATHPGTRVNPVVRFSINSLNTSDTIYIPGMNTNYTPTYQEVQAFKKQLEKGAYIRIWATANRASDSETIAHKKLFPSYYYEDNGVTTIGWSFPYNGWIQIYSGRRFCSSIDNGVSTGTHAIPMRWFVIKDIDEEYDGVVRKKTVSAYSFEYTISNKTVSLSEDTLPFYIPEQITDIVNGNEWIVDKEYGTHYILTARRGKQYMTTGVLNQLLELLPDWSVGHISSELMTRYRKIGDVDNANLYSFMMNDIQSTYQCYFVFDCDNMTISAYTQEDIIQNNEILLNWNNAIKGLNITNHDVNSITALRVHTEDDIYGVGLVNPTGNPVIYNFDSVLPQLDFVADTSSSDPLNRNKITVDGVVRNRTLKEAVIEWQRYTTSPSVSITVPITSSVGDGDTVANTYESRIFNFDPSNTNTLNMYRDVATRFVECNMALIKCESALNIQYAEYKKVIDKISIYHDSKNLTGTPIRDEVIRTPSQLDGYYINSRESFANNESLYLELADASKKYHQAKAELESKHNDYNSYLKVLQGVSKRANINYHKQVSLTAQYIDGNGLDEHGEPIVLSILTPAEILALQPFIREGDWTNDNIVFSEDYDEKDIIGTLTDVYNQAKSDMDLFLSKPNYDFEVDSVNWTTLTQMQRNFCRLKLGQTLYINTVDDNYVIPVLLELHINYKDDNDFKMTLTTDYKRRPLQFRFADLYGTITQTSVTDNAFTFDE